MGFYNEINIILYLGGRFLENNSFIGNVVGKIVEYDVIPVEKKCEIEAFLESAFEIGKDLINKIPVLPEIIKGGSSFRDKVLLKKIYSFLQGINSVSKEEVKSFFEKDINNFSEKLLIILDKIDFEEKIEYLSFLFKMLMKDEIDNKLFFRTCKILDSISYADLELLETKEKYDFSNENDILFYGYGVLENKKQPKDGSVQVNKLGMLELSPVGEILLKIKNLSKEKGDFYE